MHCLSPKITILYIEDEPGNRLGMSSLLSAVFPSVNMHIAGNGQEAQRLFKEHRPNIVLTDISLPDVDGTQLASEFRTLSPDVIMIFLSGRDYREYPNLIREVGFAYFLNKPVDCVELIEIIRNSIATATLEKCR